MPARRLLLALALSACGPAKTDTGPDTTTAATDTSTGTTTLTTTTGAPTTGDSEPFTTSTDSATSSTSSTSSTASTASTSSTSGTSTGPDPTTTTGETGETGETTGAPPACEATSDCPGDGHCLSKPCDLVMNEPGCGEFRCYPECSDPFTDSAFWTCADDQACCGYPCLAGMCTEMFSSET